MVRSARKLLLFLIPRKPQTPRARAPGKSVRPIEHDEKSTPAKRIFRPTETTSAEAWELRSDQNRVHGRPVEMPLAARPEPALKIRAPRERRKAPLLLAILPAVSRYPPKQTSCAKYRGALPAIATPSPSGEHRSFLAGAPRSAQCPLRNVDPLNNGTTFPVAWGTTRKCRRGMSDSWIR